MCFTEWTPLYFAYPQGSGLPSSKRLSYISYRGLDTPSPVREALILSRSWRPSREALMPLRSLLMSSRPWRHPRNTLRLLRSKLLPGCPWLRGPYSLDSYALDSIPWLRGPYSLLEARLPSRSWLPPRGGTLLMSPSSWLPLQGDFVFKVLTPSSRLPYPQGSGPLLAQYRGLAHFIS